MYLECTCADISLTKWERLMTGAKRMDKRKLNRLVKKELPELYEDLALNLYNPYEYYKTPTHYILVHSGIEYFLHK
jgi:hypothetical protein